MPLLTTPWNGQTVDIPDRSEVRAIISAELREDARGWKWMRLPETLSGKPAASAITLGAGTGQIVGPESGYAWVLRRLLVSGLTSGTTPDVVNLYRNDRFAVPLWQFNGNNFGYTFEPHEINLMSGETFSLQNVGSIAATGLITLSGELIEVPAEMLWKVR